MTWMKFVGGIPIQLNFTTKESPMLAKTFNINKYNHQPDLTSLITKPGPSVPCPNVSYISRDGATLPWATCFKACSPSP